jgi:Peptidase of plants and bacteria
MYSGSKPFNSSAFQSRDVAPPGAASSSGGGSNDIIHDLHNYAPADISQRRTRREGTGPSSYQGGHFEANRFADNIASNITDQRGFKKKLLAAMLALSTFAAGGVSATSVQLQREGRSITSRLDVRHQGGSILEGTGMTSEQMRAKLPEFEVPDFKGVSRTPEVDQVIRKMHEEFPVFKQLVEGYSRDSTNENFKNIVVYIDHKCPGSGKYFFELERFLKDQSIICIDPTKYQDATRFSHELTHAAVGHHPDTIDQHSHHVEAMTEAIRDRHRVPGVRPIENSRAALPNRRTRMDDGYAQLARFYIMVDKKHPGFIDRFNRDMQRPNFYPERAFREITGENMQKSWNAYVSANSGMGSGPGRMPSAPKRRDEL